MHTDRSRLGSLFVGTLFFLLAPSVKGQGDGLGTPEIAFAATPQLTFNFNDLYLGVGLGIMDHRNLWSLSTYFDARPFTRRTLIKRPDAYYQYKEWRGMVGFLLDKAFLPNGSTGFYLEGGAAYTFGDFRATGLDPTPAWFFYPGLGFAGYSQSGSMFKLGAQWAPIPYRDEIASWRIKFSVLISSS